MIAIRCRCRRETFKVRPEMAGRRGRCPDCHTGNTVPGERQVDEVEEVTAEDEAREAVRQKRGKRCFNSGTVIAKSSRYCAKCGYHDTREVGTASGGRSDLGGWSSSSAQDDANRVWWVLDFLRTFFRFLR